MVLTAGIPLGISPLCSLLWWPLSGILLMSTARTGLMVHRFPGLRATGWLRSSNLFLWMDVESLPVSHESKSLESSMDRHQEKSTLAYLHI